MGEYACKKCGEVWEFVPEDYESTENWPDTCPLCGMDFLDALDEIYLTEGLWAVCVYLFNRVKIKIIS